LTEARTRAAQDHIRRSFITVNFGDKAMKRTYIKHLYVTASLLAGLGAMSSARADLVAAGNLGNASSATDVYAMTCPPPATVARARVDDLPAANLIEVSVQVVNPHGRAINATALDGFAWSLFAGLQNGPGQYLVLVNKDRPGVEAYQLELECLDVPMGMPLAGTQSWIVQDQ
jgi:hypothetical protein